MKEKNQELETIEIDLLLEAIFRYYGFDFRNYRRGTIKRRLEHRMMEEKIETISRLQDAVLHDPQIMKSLLKDFSINVTEMFRDPEIFAHFRKMVIPFLKKETNIRIWSAGCSTGEEVYSLAILLHETGLYQRSIIYATDMNEDVLAIASEGKFPLSNMQKYTRNYQKSAGTSEFSEYYFVKQGYAVFHPWLKKNIVFAHHNLAIDHSFNEFHVIFCRNVLIYFNEILKKRVYDLFYESLVNDGFLVLGDKESLVLNETADEMYAKVGNCNNIYRKIAKNDEQNLYIRKIEEKW